MGEGNKEEGRSWKGLIVVSTAGLAGVTILHGLNTTAWNGFLASVVGRKLLHLYMRMQAHVRPGPVGSSHGRIMALI